MTTKQLQKHIIKEKISNVDLVDNKIVFDGISKNNYNTIIRQLKQTEKEQGVDLSFYIEYLERVKGELLKEIKNTNEYLGTQYENEKLNVLKDVSNKLKNSMNNAKEFIPKRYSKGFKHKPLKQLQYTQRTSLELSNAIDKLYSDASGYGIDKVNQVLSATTPEEHSYYDKMMFLQGYLPDSVSQDSNKLYTYRDGNKREVICVDGKETKILSREDAIAQVEKEKKERNGLIGQFELEQETKKRLSEDEYEKLKHQEDFLTSIQFIKMGW